MPESVPNEVIGDVARAVVAEVAPQELPLFRANSEAYFKDPDRAVQPPRGKDEILGFGPGEAVAFITPFVLVERKNNRGVTNSSRHAWSR